MECPNCGKNDSAVIDSRLTQDGIAIRRRRQCLACPDRFTTYETTEERLMPFLLIKYSGQGNSIKNLRTALSFMSKTIMILSQQIKDLIQKIEQSEKAQAAEETKRKTRQRRISRGKEKLLMMTETAFKIIKRHRKGIDASGLKDKTGFDIKKTKKIIIELKKQGKIKNLRRGFYVKA